MTDDDKKVNANPPQSPQGDASAVTPAIAVRAVPFVTVNSLSDYIETIRQFARQWTPNIWFRGDSNENFPLMPSVLRLLGDDPVQALPKEVEACRHGEIQANLSFALQAKAVDRGFPADNDLVSQLVVMRHHGLLSRLLDWTVSSLTALLFSVVEGAVKSNDDSCVWVIDWGFLNQKIIGTVGGQLPWGHFRIQKMARCAFDSAQVESEEILPFIPQYSNLRHKMQKARFTMHNFRYPLYPVDQLSDSHIFLRKIVIPAKFQRNIYVGLLNAGITWDSLFPDLDGLARNGNIEMRGIFNEERVKIKAKSQAQKQPPLSGSGGD